MYTQACSSDLPESKRKARYCPNPDRGNYTKRSRKHSAKAAIAARWQKENQNPTTHSIPGSRIMNMAELSRELRN